MNIFQGRLALAEVIVIGSVGLTGLIISRPWFVVWFNSLDPFISLALWYVLLVTWLYIVFTAIRLIGGKPMALTAGQLGGIRAIGLTESIALGIFFFGFFIVWNFLESDYTTDILHAQQVPNIFRATEDGIVYIFWHQWLGASVEWAGILTYVVTPILLLFIVAILVGTKQFLLFAHHAAH